MVHVSRMTDSRVNIIMDTTDITSRITIMDITDTTDTTRTRTRIYSCWQDCNDTTRNIS
jgi:hypothetical protein